MLTVDYGCRNGSTSDIAGSRERRGAVGASGQPVQTVIYFTQYSRCPVPSDRHTTTSSPGVASCDRFLPSLR